MAINGLLENSMEDVEMSAAYRLLCEDIESETEAENSKKLAAQAKKIAKIVEHAKLNHNFDYRILDYWTKLKIGIKCPLEQCQKAIKTTNSKVDFKWISPNGKQIKIVNETVMNNKCHVFIEIPDEVFGPKDFMNLIYATKRAHYLCAIGSLIKQLEIGEKVLFSGTDLVYPNLEIHFKEGIVDISAFNQNLWKNQRFIPTIGNLRPTIFFGNSIKFNNETPTPFFNQRHLETIMKQKLIETSEKEFKNNKNARIALKMIYKFLTNRNLTENSEIVVLARLLRLIKKGEITDKQQILTVLRIFIRDFLSWKIDEVEYLDVEEALDEDVELGYRQAFDVNLIYNYWNVANKISKNDIKNLKVEFSECFPLLGDVYAFDALFVEKIPLHAQYDYYAKLTIQYSDIKHHLSQIGADAATNYDIIQNFLKLFEKTISKTIAERIEYYKIVQIEGPKTSWSIEEYADVSNELVWLIGFKPSGQWSSPLTVGPSAQDASAKEFRELWKEASELRKFADTRICECVVWGNKPDDRTVYLILQFIIQKILEIPSKKCVEWRNLEGSSSILVANASKNKESMITEAFAELSATLRSLKGIPLMITNVYGISAYIRGTEPITPSILASNTSNIDTEFALPELGKIPPYTPSVTVHLKLEYARRWGTEVEAIRRMTSMFYVTMSEKLKKRGLIAVPTIDQLFVIQNGIVFKLIIVHDKVLEILEEAVETLKDSGATRIEGSVEGMRLSAWKKRFVTEPLIQQSLQSFSTTHKTFGATVQIFKRWLGAKLLSGHLNDIAIELLVVAAMNKKGWTESKSSWCSFVRVLHLLASHNWLARPLIIDLGKNWNEEERAKLEENFVKMRPVLPPMVLITDEDIVGSKFTKEAPSGIILKRLIGLATEALKILELNVTGKVKVDLDKSLLQEDYKAYDAIIELEHEAVVRKEGLLERSGKAKKLPVVEFDPIDELVFQLNNSFSQVAIFFYNKYGGRNIAVKFKPNEEEVPAKIGRCLLHKSVGDSKLRLNREEIIENIRIIGQGIVSSARIL